MLFYLCDKCGGSGLIDPKYSPDPTHCLCGHAVELHLIEVGQQYRIAGNEFEGQYGTIVSIKGLVVTMKLDNPHGDFDRMIWGEVTHVVPSPDAEPASYQKKWEFL